MRWFDTETKFLFWQCAAKDLLDRTTHEVVSAPGYSGGLLQPLTQTNPVYHHVHDLYVDRDENIYVGEWNAEQRYPFKLTLKD